MLDASSRRDIAESVPSEPHPHEQSRPAMSIQWQKANRRVQATWETVSGTRKLACALDLRLTCSNACKEIVIMITTHYEGKRLTVTQEAEPKYHVCVFA